jgi:chorismate mutase
MIIINYIIIIIIKNGDFLTEDKIKSFNNKEEAEILLEKSRNHIDEIDNELMDLISQRTSLAKDIVLAKEYIGMPIYDKTREDAIHEKVKKLCEEKDLDVEIVDQILDMLTILNKNEQKKILRRNVDG